MLSPLRETPAVKCTVPGMAARRLAPEPANLVGRPPVSLGHSP